MNEVLIVAAEASSAHYAQRLLEYWKLKKIPIRGFGVGSKAMEDLGFERLGKSEDMAVVGIVEVIEHYSDLKVVFNRLVDAAEKRKPRVAIIMDYPDFNLMLAEKLKAMGIPVVYYISPQVWAWRKGRVKKIKKFCDRVLLLFPFEKAFYDAEGVPNDFVGHPLLDEIDPKYFQLEYQNTKRNRFGIKNDEVVIGLMPGSRRSELKLNLPIQLQVASTLARKYPQVKFVILVAPSFSKEQVQEALAEAGEVSFPYTLIKDEPFEMISVVDIMLAASGTATLQVALLQKPMVIMYRLKTLTYLIAKMVVRGVKYAGLPNLILGDLVVPEEVQSSAQKIAVEVERFLTDKEYTQNMRSRLAEISGRLGDKGATARVSKVIEDYCGKGESTGVRS